MKEKVMSAMQAFSKAMFMPVLILPIAGLLIAVGNVLTNARLMEILPFLDNPVTKGFGTILSGALVAILNNLGLIFCTGIAIGLAKKKKAEAGFTALLAFLVFINAMNKFMGLRGMLVDADALRGSGQAVVLGIQILDMGVFLGIILGCVSAYVHNRFIDTEFNNAFQIYGGARFVFIVLIPVIIILAVVLTYVWPPVQMVIDSLGYFINRTGNFGIFIYGALERLLIPTGLHHLVYTPFLYTKLGGTEQIAGQVYEGCRNIYYAEMADPSIPILSSSVVWDARGLSKMFGLVGACLAMYHTARPENRQKIKAILIPEPFYPNYYTMAYTCGATIHPIPTSPHDGYHYADRAKVEAEINEHTRAIMVTNPGNPTGAVLTPEEMRMMVDIAKEHDLFIIGDEAYREFVYAGEPLQSMGQFDDAADNVIVIDTVSKRFSACGARIGCMISRNKELMAQAMKYAQCRLSVPTLDQIASAALYTVGPEYFAAVRDEYKLRRDTVMRKLKEIPGVVCECPRGAFYVMAALPVDDADKFQMFLLEEFDDHGDTVMFAPGEPFYATPGKGKNEIRIAYVLKQEALERAMDLLRLGIEAYNNRK